jgi:exopolyphosphatase/pppGpp-phosphohydrolase
MDRERTVARLLRETDAMVKDNYETIVRLAQHLRARGRLSQDQVRAVIER